MFANVVARVVYKFSIECNLFMIVAFVKKSSKHGHENTIDDVIGPPSDDSDVDPDFVPDETSEPLKKTHKKAPSFLRKKRRRPMKGICCQSLS